MEKTFDVIEIGLKSAEKVRRNVTCGERSLGINRRFFRYRGIETRNGAALYTMHYRRAV